MLKKLQGRAKMHLDPSKISNIFRISYPQNFSKSDFSTLFQVMSISEYLSLNWNYNDY